MANCQNKLLYEGKRHSSCSWLLVETAAAGCLYSDFVRGIAAAAAAKTSCQTSWSFMFETLECPLYLIALEINFELSQITRLLLLLLLRCIDEEYIYELSTVIVIDHSRKKKRERVIAWH